jgi:hypothetical protein
VHEVRADGLSVCGNGWDNHCNHDAYDEMTADEAAHEGGKAGQAPGCVAARAAGP